MVGGRTPTNSDGDSGTNTKSDTDNGTDEDGSNSGCWKCLG